ncbi:hypothetical protein [Silvanigrella aquatica]|uniref:Uncharacterized protein n=1 Tax=Silvanigrella aquatica TaxID=1915309 RepID=A0A1L4CXI2_9BACT|nr:hypothetical protein [Silvanigrella aquatica]APJ02654.1 hypothetical protein AXG55_01385 [Silvanigrella aquatica]
MRKIYLFLILSLFYFKNINAIQIDLSPSEKSIFSENEENRSSQWKSLRSVDALLNSMKGQIFGLSYISNVADPNSSDYEFQKSPLGLRNDSIRVKMNLQKAEDHVYLQDPEAAIYSVEKELKDIDPRNRGYISWAYKILFEAHRLRKDHNKSTQTCLKMLFIGGQDESLFPDKWRFSCSLEFFYEAMARKKNDDIASLKTDFLIWSNSPVVKRESKYMILSAVYVGLGLRKIYSNDKNSIQYIEEAIEHSNSGNPFIGRAYLALSLLKYEMGNKKESLALLRFLTGEFKGYEEHYRYFENDEVSRIVSRLCLARYHASLGNYSAAETWYKDIFLAYKISGVDLLNKEKVKAYLEYAHILYMKKKYLESAIQYKHAIQESGKEVLSIENNNLSGTQRKIRISNFVLAKILSKTSGHNFQAEAQLLDLLSQADADIQFLKKVQENYKKSKEEGVENILALASLAQEYGIQTQVVETALRFRKAYYHLEQEIAVNRSDLANALHAADYTYTGINDVRAISTLSKLSDIVDTFKNIILELDSFDYKNWNRNNSGLEFAKKNREELLKRFISMYDDINKYKIKTQVEDSLFEPKTPLALANLSKNMNKMNAEMASVKFLYSAMDNKVPKVKLNENAYLLENSYSKYAIDKMYQNFSKIAIDERYFQLSHSLKGAPTFIFEKKSEVIQKTMDNLYKLHKNFRNEAFSIGDIELNNSINETWSNLIETYKQLLIAVSNIKDRMITERKDILSKADYIKNLLTDEEKTLDLLKLSILNEYVKLSKNLADSVLPRANEFKQYVNIGLSEHNKGVYDIKKENDEEIRKTTEERENWLNTLRQTLNMDLIR